MGIYLGQLPPAEVARLKAELAETLIANFCYPRFFDNRVETLRMRPVDRAKRQEVWLFLSSVDFTSWSRVDLTSPDFQHQIERLFIQFVQRNRAFFGEQGRRRMSDVRMLINSSAASVVQGLRNHLTGQRQGNPPFGSPRPAVSWSQSNVAGRPELTWEQIASATMMLQQQIQELRGEVRPVTVSEQRPTNGATRRPAHPQMTTGTAGKIEQDIASVVQIPTLVLSNNLPSTVSKNSAPVNPAASVAPAAPTRRQEPPVAPAPSVPAVSAEAAAVSTPPSTRQPAPGKVSGPLPPSTRTNSPLPPPSTRTSGPLSPPATKTGAPSPSLEAIQPSATSVPSAPVQARNTPQTAPSAPPTAVSVAPGRESVIMTVGEDDIAIFEQMRHQLLIWLRVEAIRAGLEFSSNVTPAQLLDMLRQQARFDETRLQVVSTLLNLSNQVIKTGMVSILDYKQALMFHLMHTRR